MRHQVFHSPERSLPLSQRRNKDAGKGASLSSLRNSKWFFLTGKRGWFCFVFPRLGFQRTCFPGKSTAHSWSRVWTVVIFWGKFTPFQAVTPSSGLCWLTPTPNCPIPAPRRPPPKITAHEVETTKFVQHGHRLANSQDFRVSGKMGLSENKGCLALPSMFPQQTRRETSLKTDKIPDWVVAPSAKKVVQNCQEQQPAPNPCSKRLTFLHFRNTLGVGNGGSKRYIIHPLVKLRGWVLPHLLRRAPAGLWELSPPVCPQQQLPSGRSLPADSSRHAGRFAPSLHLLYFRARAKANDYEIEGGLFEMGEKN